VEESAHVIFDESGDQSNAEHSEDLELEKLMKIQRDSLIQDPVAEKDSNEESSAKPTEEPGSYSSSQEEDSYN